MVKFKKICFVVTAEFAVRAFLLDHLRALSEVYEVTVVVNTNDPKFLSNQGIEVSVIPLNISRPISLVSDFVCLVKLLKVFLQHGFSAVHSITPKAGLLAMFAAYIARVPVRTHTFTGQVWVTKTGYKRVFLKYTDCLIAFLTTCCIVDSPSQQQFLIKEHVIVKSKAITFGKGSIAGVDLTKFKPNVEKRILFRKELNFSNAEVVFLFLGRLTRDKGVLDLAKAFAQLNVSNARLLFVGPDEQGMQSEIIKIIEGHISQVSFIGYTNTPEFYMAAADVFCLPSYREGFGSVVIEAAAVGIPVIASRIYGITDAVVDNVTGLLHEPRDVDAITNYMKIILVDQSLRMALGNQAQERAIKDFDSQLLIQSWVNYYQESFRLL